MTAHVMENLALLTDAPGGIDRLRSLVLELAVGGRLSACDGEAHESFIHEFCSVQGGIQKTPLRSPVKHHFPYLRVANVQRARIDTSNLERYELLPEELDRWRLASGDILIVEGNGSESEIGRCAIWRGEVPNCVFQNHLMRVRPGPKATVEFLALYLNSPVGTAHMRRLAITTSGLFNLSVGKIRSIPVRLPPLAEQQRIVAKVDELMALCDRLEARQQDAEAAHARLVQVLLDSLTQARDADEFQACWQRLAGQFAAAFATDASVDALKQTVMRLGVEGRLTLGVPRSTWRAKSINDFCTVQGGIQKTPLRMPVRHHFPYLRVANVQRGRIDVTQLERYELAPDELERWRLNPGDLLVVEGNGSESEIGRCAIWRGEAEDCVYQNHLMRVRPTGDDAVEYLALYLNSPVGTAHMRRLAITTSGLFNLSVGKIRSIPIELPQLDEQLRIVAKVNELLTLCDQLKTHIAAARAKHAQLAQALVEAAVA